MEGKKNTLKLASNPDRDGILELGSWLGRRQAFGLVASRCTAADAECLKKMRDSGEYKKIGLNWEEFCQQKAGVSRRYADKLIGHLEEFGSNYFRLSELMEISSETYRLIAGAVADDGIEYQGHKIPLTSGNRQQVRAVVAVLREGGAGKPKAPHSADSIRRRMNALLEDARSIEVAGPGRLVLVGVIEEGARNLTCLAQQLRGFPPIAA